MAVRDLLERYELFRFAPDALEEIDRHFARFAQASEIGPELAHLSAAEFAAFRSLLGEIGWRQRDEVAKAPTTVTQLEAQLALAKGMCTPFWPCDPSPGEPIDLSDVVLFAGDIQKLRAIGITDPTTLTEDPRGVAEELERRYAECGVDWGERIARTGYVRLEVFLWIMKLTLLRAPDRVEDEASDYGGRLGIIEPEAMGV